MRRLGFLRTLARVCFPILHSFVLNTLGIQYIAATNPSALIFGHPFSGAPTAAGMLNDTRLCGEVNLDVTGIRTTLAPESQAAAGFFLGKRVLEILSRYLSAFFVFILRGNEGEGF
jgi:hypothetical protein